MWNDDDDFLLVNVATSWLIFGCCGLPSPRQPLLLPARTWGPGRLAMARLSEPSRGSLRCRDGGSRFHLPRDVPSDGCCLKSVSVAKSLPNIVS